MFHTGRLGSVMADCERLKGCPFFRNQMAFLPKAADEMKQRYCHGDFSGCARHMLISRGIIPAKDLFPNEEDKALRILARENKLAIPAKKP